MDMNIPSGGSGAIEVTMPAVILEMVGKKISSDYNLCQHGHIWIWAGDTTHADAEPPGDQVCLCGARRWDGMEWSKDLPEY